MRFYNLPLLPLGMNLDSITSINLSYNNFKNLVVIYKKKLKFLMELDKSFKITKLKNIFGLITNTIATTSMVHQSLIPAAKFY